MDILQGCLAEASEKEISPADLALVRQIEFTIEGRDMIPVESLQQTTANYCICFRILVATVQKVSSDISLDLKHITDVNYSLDRVRNRLEEIGYVEQGYTPETSFGLALLKTIEHILDRICINATALAELNPKMKIKLLVDRLESTVSSVNEKLAPLSVKLRNADKSVPRLASELHSKTEAVIETLQSLLILITDVDTPMSSVMWIHAIVSELPELLAAYHQLEAIIDPAAVPSADEFLAEWRELHREFPDLAPPPSMDDQASVSI